MSINMYLDEVQTQTQYANKLAVAYRNYAGKIDDVLQAYYNSELSGKAYDSNKEYFLSVYTPLSRGLKLVSNSLMNAHYMFPLMYESDVYTGNIEEYKLNDQIRQCKDYIYLLDSIQQGLPYMDWYLEQNIEAMERLLRTLTQRLASFRSFNHESPRIFDDVLSLIDKVEVGLILVESGKGYDELTQSFNIRGLDLSWANEINKIADERKYKTTMREQELEVQGQVFKEGFEKKQYISVDIYGQQKMMWLDNPLYISQEDIQFNDKYELWLNEMADLYGKEAIFGESKDIDYLSQMAWEAREGIDYYSGIKLTDTDILQRKAALLSFGANIGIGMYWSSYGKRMINKQESNTEEKSKFIEVFDTADNYKLSDDIFENHIVERHGPNSSYGNKSQFNSDFDIKNGIDSTLKGDNFIVKSNTGGRDGYIFEQTFTEPIGVGTKGKSLYTIKVVIDNKGNVITAFPQK